MCSGEIDRELGERFPLNFRSSTCEEHSAQLLPAVRLADIHELRDPRGSKREGNAWRIRSGGAHESNGRDPGKLSNHGADPRLRESITPSNGDEHGIRPFRLEVADELRHVIAVDRSVRAFSGCVDARALGWREKG